MGEVGCLKDGRFHNLKAEKISSYRRNIISPLGTATVLKDSHSGSIVLMDASDANTIKLPPISTVSPGWHIKVILDGPEDNPFSDGKIESRDADGVLEAKMTGGVNSVDDDASHQTVSYHAAGNTITFFDPSVAGSWVEIYSNGPLGKFYVYGMSKGAGAEAADKFTLTAASE
tara:strand:+ start:839 stop:1357 length:519 start_codon:yes stop_codon:yes gene_type:complete